MPRLTHYTSSLDAVRGILLHGFAWVPNRRNLAVQLIPERDFAGREPQQFGMISFTERVPHEAAAHRTQFGDFGITVSAEWATKNRAQRVIYVGTSGPLADSLRRVFAIGYKDLEARIKYPDDGAWQMSFENRAMAGAVAGAALWANLLTVWEYLEPESSAEQREWRIVNDDPDYSIAGSTREIIAAVSPPAGWAKFTRVVPIDVASVEQFVCPSSKVAAFRQALPHEFATVAIVESDG